MEEALEKQEAKQQEYTSKKQLNKSRYNGRVKKRQWENYDDTSTANKKPSLEQAERVRRRKCLMLMGYGGANYYGMQRNPGMKTIENDLMKALLENKLITEEHFNQAQQIQFQRAARTDKGVSAARQCCSLKLPEEIDLIALNANLPDEIRVFSIRRVTKGFNAKDQCNARTYTYTLPTVALASHADTSATIEDYRVPEERMTRLNEILKQFEGTKNYHNFTSRKEYVDPSSKRYIMNFECGTPFLSPDNIEFVTIKVKGQSFMLHQIRKMIGLALAVLRDHTVDETIKLSFTEQRIDIPMAPGLGLVLDQVHYDRYNQRYGEDGLHMPLTWEQEEPEIQEFIKKHIFTTIFETERKEKPMMAWLDTLGMHSYDVRTDDKNNKQESEEKNDDEIENVDAVATSSS